jgi:hypothetical protein
LALYSAFVHRSFSKYCDQEKAFGYLEHLEILRSDHKLEIQKSASANWVPVSLLDLLIPRISAIGRIAYPFPLFFRLPDQPEELRGDQCNDPAKSRVDILLPGLTLIISGNPLDSDVKIDDPRQFRQGVRDLAISSRISLAEATSW